LPKIELLAGQAFQPVPAQAEACGYIILQEGLEDEKELISCKNEKTFRQTRKNSLPVAFSLV
jgi:hypothetical protein